MNARLLCYLLAWFSLAGFAQAQLVASLKLSKSQYIAGEPVIAQITITNHAGRELTFQGTSRSDWLDFLIRNSRGTPATPVRGKTFGSVRIGAGESMSRSINLAEHFYLRDAGTYSITGIVRLPGQDNTQGTSTNRLLFTLNPGRTYWTQQVGLPGKPGQTREFRILTFTGNQKTEIYTQITDNRTGLPFRTFPLGDVLLMRKPSVTVDRNQHLHVLFLSTPTMWVHCQIDTDGNLLARDVHQRGAQGDPGLITFGDGTVRVSNSIPYDAKAVAEARAKSRKLSERPQIVYD